MIAITDTERQLIHDIIVNRLPRCQVIAFGSRIKGTHVPASDLDIAIIANDDVKVPVWDIREDFMESDIPFKVDVLDYRAVSKAFQKIINNNFEVIFDTRLNTEAFGKGLFF